MKKEQSSIYWIFILCLSVCAVFCAIWTFTGTWPWVHQPYNSYILQAQAWKSGSLSLPENYHHLELAIFNGKYFVSFPPFPSYVMFPFVCLGFNGCDGLIAFVSALLGAVYAFLVAEHFGVKKERALLFSLLLTIGSNWLFTSQIAWVWFIAQNMAFTLSLMAIYYALKNRPALSLALWACAVGCRPFQIFCLPVILYFIYKAAKENGQTLRSKWKCVIPMAVIALSYMILNYARFKNPLEFGHNYLPEFTEAENGQFSLVYILDNIKCLFRLPKVSFSGAWEYQAFNGTNIFIVSPIFISYIAYAVYAIVKNKADRKLLAIAAVSIVLQLLVICAHKTMGGSQFGNRYTNDVLPLVFLSLASSLGTENDYDKFNIPLLAFGLIVNAVGSVLYYM